MAAFAVIGIVVGVLLPLGGAPEMTVYDVGLPVDAPMRLQVWRGFTVAPDGSFVVYVAARGSETELWYRDLRSDEARPIPGTEGALQPAISSDGTRVAFAQDGKMQSVALDGGPVTTLAELEGGEEAVAQWLPDGRLLILDKDGSRLRWLDVAAASVESWSTEDGCFLPRPMSNGQVLCTTGFYRYASIADGSGASTFLRSHSSPTSPEESSGLLRGAGFRVVDDEYVIYTSMAGEIRGARLDRETMEVGRSVALVSGVRREPYMGVGQFDVSDAGALVYVPGVNAGVGQLVEQQGGQEPNPLRVDPAEFLRFDLSPVGNYLAVVLEGVLEEELHIFDLSGGPGQLMLEAFSISEPLWTPDGDTVVISVRDAGGGVAIVAGARTGGGALDTIVAGVQMGPLSYHPSGLVVGHAAPWVIAIDRSADPVRVDTLMTDAYFPVLAGDGRWLAYQPDGEGLIMLTRLPEMDLRIPVADGFEPQWTSPEELSFWTFEEGFFRVSVDTKGDVRVGQPRPWFMDPQFLDTPGQSYTLSGDGTAVYVRGLHAREGSYLRVIPNWVEQMKRAVYAASR